MILDHRLSSWGAISLALSLLAQVGCGVLPGGGKRIVRRPATAIVVVASPNASAPQPAPEVGAPANGDQLFGGDGLSQQVPVGPYQSPRSGQLDYNDWPGEADVRVAPATLVPGVGGADPAPRSIGDPAERELPDALQSINEAPVLGPIRPVRPAPPVGEPVEL